MSNVNRIKKKIETELDKGNNKFILFPFGDIGIQVKQVLENAYNIQPEYILDNKLYKYNDKIRPLAFLENVDYSECVLILCTTNIRLCEEFKKTINSLYDIRIIEIESEFSINTRLFGKYSYGPLDCPIDMVESIGAFCSFAKGTAIVPNHPMEYISTHPIVYRCGENDEVHSGQYDDFKSASWYLEGLRPKGRLKSHKVTIGNDVWLGSNVKITNGAKIGNGVIAAAGAVITKDVPDYAIVAGVPAKVLKYRYTQTQIDSLNKIKWWDWSDEKIIECQDDFYIHIDEFIRKHMEK